MRGLIAWRMVQRLPLETTPVSTSFCQSGGLRGSPCIRLTCNVGMCISFSHIGYLLHVSCIEICAHGHAIPHGDLHVPAMPTARTAAHQMPQRPNADRRIETWSRSSARTPDRCSQDEHCHPLSSYAPGMPRLHSARLGRYAWVCHA